MSSAPTHDHPPFPVEQRPGPPPASACAGFRKVEFGLYFLQAWGNVHDLHALCSRMEYP
jgi:hypothetical protein